MISLFPSLSSKKNGKDNEVSEIQYDDTAGRLGSAESMRSDISSSRRRLGSAESMQSEISSSRRRLGSAESMQSEISILSHSDANFYIHTSRLKRRGLYEIEYLGDMSIGIVLRNCEEHKFPYGEVGFVIDVGGIVEGVNEDSIERSKALNSVVENGDILVAINDNDLGNADMEEVAAILNDLKNRDERRKLTFLKPYIFPLEIYLSPHFSGENFELLTEKASTRPSTSTDQGTDDSKSVHSRHSFLSFNNIIGTLTGSPDRSLQNTQRSNTERNATTAKVPQQDVIIEDDEDDNDEMETIPAELSPQHKRHWMDLIDLRNCDRPKDRQNFWKHRRREFQRAPLPLLKPSNLIPINEENGNEEIEKKGKKEPMPIGQKFKKLMGELKWYEQQYLIPESPNVPISVTRSDAARDYIEEKMEIIKNKTKKRQLKKQIATKLEILGKDKETDIILSLVEQQDAKKIPSRTTFITTTKGEVKVAKVPPPPSEQMKKALKAQEDARHFFEIEKAKEDAQKENERLEKRSTRLVERLINRIVDLEFEECTEQMCENIAEIKFDNYCRGIADSALMKIAMEEIAAYTNSNDCIGFYEECLVIKENNMCEKAADLIFKAVFDVELYMQSKELFKRMADVQICEKAAERFIKEKIKKEIEFDRQEMLKRTEFFANQTVNTILTKNLDNIVGELIGIEIDHYLLIVNDIDARNKYELEITEESIDESFDNILHAEIKACLVELTEFQKELDFQVLLSKNDKIVDIIMDNVFNEEIEGAIAIVDDGMFEDLETFLELQESAATSRKIERRLKRIIERVFSAVYTDCIEMELQDLVEYGISEAKLK